MGGIAVEVYEKYLTEQLEIIRGEGKARYIGEGITSYPTRADENNQRIHAMCLELEKRGLIYRHNENDVSIVWMPTKQTDPQGRDDAPEWYKRIMEAEAKILAQTEQDREDLRQREASLQQTIADLQAVLFNEAGLERLANISDEEWQRAESEDDED